MIITSHIIALLLGIVLDLLIGDPYFLPHPIRLIGWVIKQFENKLLEPRLSGYRNSEDERTAGLIMCCMVTALTGIVTLVIIYEAYRHNNWAGILVEAILSYYCLAARCLRDESMKVYDALLENDMTKARKAVGMIVGRDTDCLDYEGVIRATVETIAENASDGVIAPLLYLIILGPVGGLIYKAVNTMDSMVGYHNDRYEYFGYYPAKTDDYLNFLPSRICAVGIIAASFFLGNEYSYIRAIKIFLRDRFNHKSPNSAQSESAMAGALGVMLAGPATYFGKVVDKPYIGDPERPIEINDIKRANLLMYVSYGIAVVVLFIIYVPIMQKWV